MKTNIKKSELIRTPAAVSSPHDPIYRNSLLLVFKSCVYLFMSTIDWMGRADPDWGSECLKTVLITVTHNREWFRISRLFSKSLLSLKSAEPLHPQILPALPVMLYAAWGVKLHEKGAHSGHSADLSLASPHAAGTKRTAGWMEPSLSFYLLFKLSIEGTKSSQTGKDCILCVLVAGGHNLQHTHKSTLFDSVFTLLIVSLECYFAAGAGGGWWGGI